MRSKNNCLNDSDFRKLRRLEDHRDRSIDHLSCQLGKFCGDDIESDREKERGTAQHNRPKGSTNFPSILSRDPVSPERTEGKGVKKEMRRRKWKRSNEKEKKRKRERDIVALCT